MTELYKYRFYQQRNRARDKEEAPPLNKNKSFSFPNIQGGVL